MARQPTIYNLFGFQDLIRSNTMVDVLNSQLKQFEENDKVEKKNEIEEIIRETKLELRKTRILCYILSSLSFGACIFANWTPYYFEWEDAPGRYFLAYQLMGLLPHALFSIMMLYFISRDTKKQICYNYSSRITGAVLLINVMFLAS